MSKNISIGNGEFSVQNVLVCNKCESCLIDIKDLKTGYGRKIEKDRFKSECLFLIDEAIKNKTITVQIIQEDECPTCGLKKFEQLNERLMDNLIQAEKGER